MEASHNLAAAILKWIIVGGITGYIFGVLGLLCFEHIKK